MQIDILTLFPKMFTGPFAESIVKRAQEKGLVKIQIHDLRQWGLTERKTVDGRPYGGGVGMLLRVDVIDAALKSLITGHQLPTTGHQPPVTKTILLDATGERFTQEKARELSKIDHLILIAGHYEGVDHRVHEHLADEMISIGDYVLTGGEIPAMVIVDSVVRLIPGVLSKEEATQIESFNKPGKKEFPQYTRPAIYRGWKVPEILLSGHHAKIAKWRINQPE